MDYTGNEFYQDTNNTNIPYTRHVASATWLQGQQTIDKSAEIKQALEMAKGNTFRLKKKVSTVTKIELLPQPLRKRQIETIAIDKKGNQVGDSD